MLRTSFYTIPSKKLQAPVTIAHLSDLHGFAQSPSPAAIVQAVQKGNPDLLVMTGDMVDSHTKQLQPFLDLCRELSKLCPVYFISGNHEQALKRDVYPQLLHKLQAQGITVLDNDRQYLTVKGQLLALFGLVTPLSTYREKLVEWLFHLQVKDSDLQRVLGKCPQKPFTLLLYHNPLRFPLCARWGADLTLSGHIHGGIIQLPVLGGLLSPDATFFPVYDGGHFESQGHHLVVSRGLGNNTFRRINNPPELSMITLTPL